MRIFKEFKMCVTKILNDPLLHNLYRTVLTKNNILTTTTKNLFKSNFSEQLSEIALERKQEPKGTNTIATTKWHKQETII